MNLDSTGKVLSVVVEHLGRAQWDRADWTGQTTPIVKDEAPAGVGVEMVSGRPAATRRRGRLADWQIGSYNRVRGTWLLIRK